MRARDYFMGSVLCFVGGILLSLNYLAIFSVILERDIRRGTYYEELQIKGLFASLSQAFLLFPEWQPVFLIATGALLGVLGIISTSLGYEKSSEKSNGLNIFTYAGYGIALNLTILLILPFLLSIINISSSRFYGLPGYSDLTAQYSVLFEDILPLEPLPFLLLLLEFVLIIILLLCVLLGFNSVESFSNTGSEDMGSNTIAIPILASIMLLAHVSLYSFMRMVSYIDGAGGNETIKRFFSGLWGIQIVMVVFIQICLILVPIVAISEFKQISLLPTVVKNRLTGLSQTWMEDPKQTSWMIAIVVLVVFGVHSLLYPYLAASEIQPLRLSSPVNPIITPILFLIGCVLSYLVYRVNGRLIAHRGKSKEED